MSLDFSKLILNEQSPIYMQIIRYIKVNIAAGQVQNGEELPSRRFLSASLNVNPNTIQKAYKQIEEEGLLLSHTGSKSLLKFTEETVIKIRHELIEQEANQFIASLKQIGISKDQAFKLLDRMWE